MATLLIALFALTAVSLGQDSDEGCSFRETVYPRERIPIRDEASHTGEHVRLTVPWETLNIIGTKPQGIRCWLQVQDGWLIESDSALSSNPPGTAAQRASAATGACYQFDIAYVAGNMNIRARASTNSRVVARARFGDVFAVSGSIAGADWCWLQIAGGWLANTSRVRSTKPAQPVFTSAGPPPAAGMTIEGSETFVAQINAALDFLRSRAPQWYAYVTRGPRKIAEVRPPAPDGYATHDHFFISSSAANNPSHLVAWLMVHEACHVQRSLAGLFAYDTAKEQDIEEYLCDHVAHVSQQQVDFGRLLMAYTPSQVAHLMQYGKLEQRTGTGSILVSYLPGKVRQWLLEGIDFFGMLRTEMARADHLLG